MATLVGAEVLGSSSCTFEMYCGLLLDDASLRVLSIRLGMLAYHINTFYDNAILFSEDFKNLTGLSLVVTRVHKHGVAFPDVKFLHDS